MTNALVFAAVTTVLKTVLENQLARDSVASAIGDVRVSALSPDRIPVGAEERNQLNLFLYRLTPNTSWRRSKVPSNSEPTTGDRRALALDLHYLVAAYGEQDLMAEILLGEAMQVLQETRVVPASAVRGALAASPPGGAQSAVRTALAASDFTGQPEQVSIVEEFLGTEELARLWSALQARYRPCATYAASFVLIGN